MKDIKAMVANFKHRMSQYPLVNIQFLDHARCSGDNPTPGACEVTGRLIGEDAYTYYVAAWIFDSENDEHTDVYPVVKTVGIKVKRLK